MNYAYIHTLNYDLYLSVTSNKLLAGTRNVRITSFYRLFVIILLVRTVIRFIRR